MEKLRVHDWSSMQFQFCTWVRVAANHTEHWFGESKNDKEEPIMDSWHDSWTQISNISDIVLRMYVLKNQIMLLSCLVRYPGQRANKLLVSHKPPDFPGAAPVCPHQSPSQWSRQGHPACVRRKLHLARAFPDFSYSVGCSVFLQMRSWHLRPANPTNTTYCELYHIADPSGPEQNAPAAPAPGQSSSSFLLILLRRPASCSYLPLQAFTTYTT